MVVAISDYLNGVPDGDNITIRQLLSHTSGLFNYNDDLITPRVIALGPPVMDHL